MLFFENKYLFTDCAIGQPRNLDFQCQNGKPFSKAEIWLNYSIFFKHFNGKVNSGLT